MAVLPLLAGSQTTPRCGAKFAFGCRTRFPNPVSHAFNCDIGPRSLSVRPVSRTQLTPIVTVRFGLALSVSPKYAESLLSCRPPPGKPNCDFSELNPAPFPK